MLGTTEGECVSIEVDVLLGVEPVGFLLGTVVGSEIVGSLVGSKFVWIFSRTF